MSIRRGVPHVYTPENLVKSTKDTAAGLPDGRWVAARPLGWQGWCIAERLKIAFNVFIGKWDALRWEGQE